MRQKKKSILFLTSHLPYPPLSGGRLREYELVKRISEFYNIYLVVITKTYQDDLANISFIKDYCVEISVFSCLGAHEKRELEPVYPEKILRIISYKARDHIENILKNVQIDLIHAEGFYMGYYFPEMKSIPIVVAEQNIEFNILEQEIKLESEDLFFLRNQYDLMKEYETSIWKNVEACVVLTDFDYNIVKKYISEDKIYLIQDGCDHLQYESEVSLDLDSSDDKILLITGNFQYKPNIDAVTYFYHDLFPGIKKNAPDAKLYIVGNQPGENIMKLKNDIDVKVFPNVPNMKSFIKKASVFVCPLRLGGGIKVKMLEALYCNAAIVTTPIGAQGLPVTNPPGFFEASSDQEFIDKVLLLLSDDNARMALKHSTKGILNKLLTWQDSVNKLVDIYDALT